MADLKLRKGEYLPQTGMTYPDDPMARLVPADRKFDYKFDETYTFLDDSLSFRIQRIVLYFLVFCPYYLVHSIKFGLRFRNRSVFRRYRKEFSNGIVSIANHCYVWDGMAIAEGMHHTVWMPMLGDHLNSHNRWHLKHFGGIPLSDGSFGGQKKFNEAFDEIHRRKGWIHIFPEARNWHFYKPLRPFMKGAFTMAYKYDCPILPIGISFRERKGIYRLFAKKEIPLITINFGEPVFPDRNNARKVEVERLLRESHSAICGLVGIVENPWPASIDEI